MIFQIPGEPRGKGRPRRSKNGGMFTDEKTENYEALIKYAAHQAMQGRKKLEGPVSVHIAAHYKMPKSSKKKTAAMLEGDILPTKRPDLDNIVKSVLDGVNGIVFHDDCQVVRIVAGKQFGADPCVRVTIDEIENREKDKQ